MAEQLESLLCQVRRHIREAGDVSTRLGQARDDVLTDWVAAERDHDRNCGRSVSRCPYGRSQRDDDVDLVGDKLRRKDGQLVHLPVGPLVGQLQVAALAIAESPQGVAELLGTNIVRSGVVEHSDMGHALLRM